jgi:xanthine dehydrogenase accessory factor
LKEIRNILKAFDELSCSAGNGVLASVVHTSGSTYRRPGARALIMPDDQIIGLVGGGCLEADLLEKARAVRESREPKRLHYDSASDADIIWGLGLGCAGIVDVLLERVGADNPGPLDFIRRCISNRRPGVLATVIRSDSVPLGARWMQGPDGCVDTTGEWEPPMSLQLQANTVLTEGKGRLLREGSTDILLEWVAPLTRLVVFGAGADAIAVVRIASELGWNIEVIDKRPSYARPERLPDADKVEQWTPEEAAEHVALDEYTACLLMTHNYLQDRDLLRFLPLSPARYVGVLGPKRRTDKILADLRSEGIAPSDTVMASLYSPAGLDLGADSPEQIALSIVAEIQSVFGERTGGFLRDRQGLIHERVTP